MNSPLKRQAAINLYAALHAASTAALAARPDSLGWTEIKPAVEQVDIHPKIARRLLERWAKREILFIGSGHDDIVADPKAIFRLVNPSYRHLEQLPGGKHYVSGVLLVKRPRPDYHHPESHVPHHPVVICARKRLIEVARGWTGDGATTWSHDAESDSGGWLIHRWNGLDIDYGHVVRGFKLPDGTTCGAFTHDETAEPWTLLRGAVWLDDRLMPGWLEDAGVTYPPDHWTRRRILETLANDGLSGFGREASYPAFWPALPSEGGSQIIPRAKASQA